MRHILLAALIGLSWSCGSASFSGATATAGANKATSVSEPTAEVMPESPVGETPIVETSDVKTPAPLKDPKFGFNVYHSAKQALKASTAHLGTPGEPMHVEFDMIDLLAKGAH